jgi:type VI secretion system secreted protein Hcp
MATDIFLKLDGIKGESQDDKHKDEIELVSFSFGASNFTKRSAGSGGGAGKVSLQDFHFVMRTNKASPTLFLSCASGKHISSAVLSVRKAGGTQVDYLKYTFTDVLISSYQTGGSSADVVPTDQISLNFIKLESTFTPLDERGGLLEPVTVDWNVLENRAS